MKVHFAIAFSTIFIFSLSSLTAQESAHHFQVADIHKADSLFFASNWKNASQEYVMALAVDSNKTKPILWNRLGFCYYQLGRIDEAISSYNTSIQNKPPAQLLSILHSRLAKAFAIKKEDSKAFLELEQANANGFTNLKELDTAREFNHIRADSKFKSIRKKTEENAFPCMADAHNREFDFWVGEWEVFVTGTKNAAGHSLIQKASGDCMILENWTSAAGSFNGKSMNFVDPKTNKWEQVWVGSDGRGNHVGRFVNGTYKDQVMQFEFETTDAQGVKSIGKFRFFNEGPDQVRQLSETSSDNGSTWITNYDFTYRRKK
jgi:hypothetical protein